MYQQANKRIIKNTFLLYVRMLISMIFSLYTSRLILGALGVEDFGIYNVVAGFVSLIAFVNGAMVSASRRYLTIAIADNDIEKQKKYFSASFYIHIGIALLIVVIALVVGIWFIRCKMSIPVDRIDTAYWVFFYSIASVVALCMTVPHNALIVANEKMGAFAYLSLFDVILKLFIAIYISKITYDRLYYYSLFLCITSMLVRLLYVIYCHISFKNTSYKFPKDLNLVRDMMNFAGWNFFSALSTSMYQHGINILLNVFFGPVVNAARGIAVQVQGTIYLIAVNFQQAVNPQITKNYALGDHNRLQQLVCVSTKFSYYLVFIVSVPIFIETSAILTLWLGQIPGFTIDFIRFSLCINLIEIIAMPFTTAILSSGIIKKYQFMTGIIMLSILPVSYILLKYGCNPQTIYLVNFIIIMLLSYCQMRMASRVINLQNRHILYSIIFPIFKVTLFCIILCSGYILFLRSSNSYVDIFIEILLAAISILLLGLKRNERLYVFKFLNSRLWHMKS